MKMRDQIRQTDPNRAALIEKVLKESGERGVESDFQDIDKDTCSAAAKFGDAALAQGKVNDDLDGHSASYCLKRRSLRASFRAEKCPDSPW